MPGLRDDAYWVDESDHALACALYGDCLFDEVKAGAAELEALWEADAKPFGKLLKKASKTGVFGLGPTLDTKWLSKVLFGTPSGWPSGLSAKEKQVLLLARSPAGWLTSAELGDAVDSMKGFDPTFKKESGEATADALKKFAALFTAEVANKMWDNYDQISKKYGKRMRPICEQKYNEACTDAEGVEMFRGDLSRGWKMRSLPFSAITYHVYADFIGLISF